MIIFSGLWQAAPCIVCQFRSAIVGVVQWNLGRPVHCIVCELSDNDDQAQQHTDRTFYHAPARRWNMSRLIWRKFFKQPLTRIWRYLLFAKMLPLSPTIILVAFLSILYLHFARWFVVSSADRHWLWCEQFNVMPRTILYLAYSTFELLYIDRLYRT